MKYKFIFILMFLLTGLFAQTTDLNYLVVEWDDPEGSAPIDNYVVTMHSSLDTIGNIIQTKTSLFGAENLVWFAGLSKNEVYYFRIRSHNAGGYSAFSDARTGIINTSFSPLINVTYNSATFSYSELFTSNSLCSIKYSSNSDSLRYFYEQTYIRDITKISGVFTVNLNNLQPDTQYNMFIYETDTNGSTISSDILTFTTTTIPPGRTINMIIRR